MADLLFNKVSITASRDVLDKVLEYATGDTFNAVQSNLHPSDVIDEGHQLEYYYETKFVCADRIEALAKRFPDAQFLLIFRNNNESFYGYAEYADGKEIRGKTFEDCGGV